VRATGKLCHSVMFSPRAFCHTEFYHLRILKSQCSAYYIVSNNNNNIQYLTPCFQVTRMQGWKWYGYFSNRIRDRIRLEGFRFVRIRVRIFNIRYRIRIRIHKSHIYDVDIQMYLIRHGWYYLYLNSNSGKNTKTNMISAISVRIRSVFIPAWTWPQT
jgi:hypothetical protein